MSTYTVRATRWAHGWELHIDGVGVTQSRNLDGAEQMVRDYIESLTGRDTSNDEVTIKPEVGDGLDEATQAAQDAVTAAMPGLPVVLVRMWHGGRRLGSRFGVKRLLTPCRPVGRSRSEVVAI